MRANPRQYPLDADEAQAGYGKLAREILKVVCFVLRTAAADSCEARKCLLMPDPWPIVKECFVFGTRSTSDHHRDNDHVHHHHHDGRMSQRGDSQCEGCQAADSLSSPPRLTSAEPSRGQLRRPFPP